MPILRDLDSLAARLHGRRSRLAEGPRLAALCSLASPAALGALLFPGDQTLTSGGIQARLISDLAAETLWISACLGGAWGEFARWQAVRFQLENLKTALRGLSSGAARGEVLAALLPLPEGMDGYGAGLADAKTPEGLLELLPPGLLRDSFAAAYPFRGETVSPFLYEAALDRDYLAELSRRCAALRGPGGELAAALCGEEAAAFNLMLAGRGRFFHGLGKADLLHLFAPGPAMDLRRFSRLLSAGAPEELRALAAGLALDPGPSETDLSALEGLAWRRYARLAVRTLRRGHMGAAAAAAYIALRRVETADLITVAEGLRLRLEAGTIAARLIRGEEGAHA